MASTFSDSIRIELQELGANPGTWGDVANVGFNLIDEAVAQFATITITGDTSLTITNGTASSGATDQGRKALLILSGTPGTAFNLTLPEVEKGWVVWNDTDAVATIKTATDTTNVSLGVDRIANVYADGTGNMYQLGAVIADTGFVPLAEIENASTASVSAAQWGYLGNLDQDVNTTATVTFAEISATGTATLSGIQYPVADGAAGQMLVTDGAGVVTFDTPAGGGDVVGPASSTTNAIATYSNTTGGAIADSGVLIAELAKAQWDTASTTTTVTARQKILADTSGGAFTVNLPATPSTGDEVWFADPGANWATNNLTIDGNGSNIDGASTYTASVSEGNLIAVYDGAQWEVRFSVSGLSATVSSGTTQTIDISSADIFTSTANTSNVSYVFTSSIQVARATLEIYFDSPSGIDLAQTVRVFDTNVEFDLRNITVTGTASNVDAGMGVTPDGYGVITSQRTGSAHDLYQIDLSTPMIIGPFNNVKTFDIFPQSGGAEIISTDVSDDGNYIYLVDANNVVYQYDFGTPSVIETLTFNTSSALFFTGASTRFHVAKGGTKAFNVATGDIYQHTLSTPYQISTATYDTITFNPAEMTDVDALQFNGDGTKLYLLGSGGTVYQYTCASAYDMTTVTYDTVSVAPGGTYFGNTTGVQPERFVLLKNGRVPIMVAKENNNLASYKCGSFPTFGLSPNVQSPFISNVAGTKASLVVETTDTGSNFVVSSVTNGITRLD